MVLTDGYGLDFAEELRQGPSGVPVLCMSGYAEREGPVVGGHGFVHLQKPFSAEDLLGHARDLIDQHALKRFRARDIAS